MPPPSLASQPQHIGNFRIFGRSSAPRITKFLADARYIVFATFHTRSLKRSPACYDFGDRPYRIQRERKLMGAFLAAHYKGVTFFAKGASFAILELP